MSSIYICTAHAWRFVSNSNFISRSITVFIAENGGGGFLLLIARSNILVHLADPIIGIKALIDWSITVFLLFFFKLMFICIAWTDKLTDWLLTFWLKDLDFVEVKDQLPLFPNLKNLSLDIDVDSVLDRSLLAFLNSSPVLETLVFPRVCVWFLLFDILVFYVHEMILGDIVSLKYKLCYWLVSTL